MSEDAPERLRLPPASRIRSGSEIRDLMRRGKRTRTDHLDVFFAASPALRSRWGVVVPKHRHDIVERNRLKRRLREIGRTEVLPALRRRDAALDVLVRARREAYDAGFGALREQLVRWTEERCSEQPSSA